MAAVGRELTKEVTEGQFAYVNIATGETLDACPHCSEMEAALGMADRELRKYRSRISKLERNLEHEARKHPYWDEAECAHNWWAIACDHPGVKFEREEFDYLVDHLKARDRGLMVVLQAIAGAAFDPAQKPQKNGKAKKFNDLELITRSKKHLFDFAGRAPDNWKRFLLTTIEGKLS